MGFRDSINNLIRGDRPESPTELMFICGGLAVIGLMIYAAQVRVTVVGYTIPHFGEFLTFLAACKGIKVWKGKGGAATQEVSNVATPQA